MNPLEQYPGLRQFLYTAQWVANLAVGVMSVVFIALHIMPLWFSIGIAVLNFVWTYTGTVAARNISGPGVDPKTTNVIVTPPVDPAAVAKAVAEVMPGPVQSDDPADNDPAIKRL